MRTVLDPAFYRRLSEGIANRLPRSLRADVDAKKTRSSAAAPSPSMCAEIPVIRGEKNVEL